MGRARMRARRGTRCLGIAVGVLLALAPGASARVHAVIPANADGPNENFTSNENLWATGTANPLEGADQLCVVPADTGPDGACPTAGIWGQPNIIAVTGTYLQPIVPAPLPVGTWRILADNGDDGEDVISEPFYVDQCTPPADCRTALAAAELAPWKAAAGETKTGLGVACAATMAYTQDAKELAGSALTNDRRTFIMGQLQDNSASVVLDFHEPQSTEELAMGLLRHVSCGAYLAFEDIYADPPDPDFEHVTEAQAASLPTSGLAPADEAVAAMEGLRANAVAQRVASERYQGAEAGDDQGWSAFHATTVGETGFASGRQARRSVEPLRAAALQLEGDMSIQPASDAALDRIRAIRARIKAEGFTAGERADLAALGVLPSELDELRQDMGAPLPPGADGVRPADALRAEADALEPPRASGGPSARSTCSPGWPARRAATPRCRRGSRSPT